MRDILPKQLEDGRVLDPRMPSKAGDKFGLFRIVFKGARLQILSSGDFPPSAYPWEHVSIKGHGCCPTWEQMCHVKSLFWGDDECVMQLHVPVEDWVNVHVHVLHLWKPIGIEIPRPPKECV